MLNKIGKVIICSLMLYGVLNINSNVVKNDLDTDKAMQVLENNVVPSARDFVFHV